MTLTLAFYVGRGNVGDRAIRMATRSPFSHVEMLVPYKGMRTQKMLSMSSSPRDGGVRSKVIRFDPSRWTFMDLKPWHSEKPFQWAQSQLGKGYDWRAIMFTHAVALGRHNPDRWICSELIARALGFEIDAHTISPGSLYHQCSRLNAAYEKGLKATL